MKRWTSRIATITATTATVLGALGTTAAQAETPQQCGGTFVCLEDGTQFGAPADAYPAQADDENITAAMIVQDCATDKQADNPGLTCGFYPYGDPKTVGLGEWSPLTSDYVNCYGGSKFYNLTWSDHNEYFTQNSVTVGTSIEAGIEGIIKTSLKLEAQYTWGQSTGATQTFSTHVPKGYKAHLQHRYQKQVVKGVMWADYEHTGTGPMEGHGHHYWGITDFEATSPVKDDDGVVEDQVSMSKPVKATRDECPA